MDAMQVHAELRLPPPVSGGQKREDLLAFALYCVARITRDLAGVDRWDLFVVGGLDGASDAVVRAHLGGVRIEARASACDPAHAIWESICELEQPLRDAAAQRSAAA